MPWTGFKCKQCGKCCNAYIDSCQQTVSQKYVDKLIKNGRTDILAWVCELMPGVYDIWIHPRTREDASRCPWLKKIKGTYFCKIHEFKPPNCRDYPKTKKQAIEIGCAGGMGQTRE